MTLLALYAILKFWLPVISAAGIIIKVFLVTRKAFNKTKTAIGLWANTLLDNHMTHIQAAAEQAAASLNIVAETNKEFAVTMREMRDDFQTSQLESQRVTNAILTGIEVLKAKVY